VSKVGQFVGGSGVHLAVMDPSLRSVNQLSIPTRVIFFFFFSVRLVVW
jgi:hypothetical protein